MRYTVTNTLSLGQPCVVALLAQVPEAADNSRVARFSFGDLCSRAVGAGDYLAIAKRFHTVFLTGVPVLDTGVRINETRRFITLVDQL